MDCAGVYGSSYGSSAAFGDVHFLCVGTPEGEAVAIGRVASAMFVLRTTSGQ